MVLPQGPDAGLGRPREKAPQAEAALDSWGSSLDNRTPFPQGKPQATRHLLSYQGRSMGENAKDPRACLKKQAWPSYILATFKTNNEYNRLLQ